MDTRRFYLTKRGIALMAKAQTGVTLTFSKLSLGSGEIQDLMSAIEMTSLIHERGSYAVTGVRLSESGEEARVQVNMNNDNILKGYNVTEMGLYAQDPDAGEILYAIANLREEPEFIPSHSTNELTITYEIAVLVGNAANLAITYNDHLVYALKPELEDLAGIGRTKENVKQNADDIKRIQAKLFYIEAMSSSRVNRNRFNIDMINLKEEEDFGGIWNEQEGRLEI